MAGTDRHIAASAAAVWQVLIDVEQWPRWGPSVRGAVLDGGARELGLGARGTVWTTVGVRLPFVVTEFDPGRRWNWAVAGVQATAHEVSPVSGGCRVRFEVPWWAIAYLPVCAVALTRIEHLVRLRPDGTDGTDQPQ